MACAQPALADCAGQSGLSAVAGQDPRRQPEHLLAEEVQELAAPVHGDLPVALGQLVRQTVAERDHRLGDRLGAGHGLEHARRAPLPDGLRESITTGVEDVGLVELVDPLVTAVPV
jgi:hypothetical protein